AARGALDSGFAPYSPNLGLPSLREAVATRYSIDPSQVMVTCGVQEALAVAMLGLIEPGDEVLLPDPGFPAYPNLVRAAGGVPVYYPLSPGAWSIEPEEVAARITERTRAILVNTPGNPTGGVLAAKSLAALADIIARHDLIWMSDEIYEDYIYDGEHVSLADFDAASERGVRLSGLSKSHHMMGWRIGWLTGSAALVERLKPLHQHLVTCAPTVAQIAGVAALAHHEEAVAKTMEVFRGRRALALSMCEAIEGASVSSAAGAFYLFLGVHRFLSEEEPDTLALAMALLDEERVVAIPGVGFGPGGAGFLRVAYTIDERPLGEALGRLGAFLSRRA
ncbi:unnamed protein product, partial [Laminaria digitata]